jgi:pimeloyl-ACP methyl ester carboxylesterase
VPGETLGAADAGSYAQRLERSPGATKRATEPTLRALSYPDELPPFEYCRGVASSSTLAFNCGPTGSRSIAFNSMPDGCVQSDGRPRRSESSRTSTRTLRRPPKAGRRRGSTARHDASRPARARRELSALLLRTFTAFTAFALAFACSQAALPPTAETGPRAPGRNGALVDIGDRSLFLDCAGDGAPTVLFEAGGGSDGTTWRHVVPMLLRSTRTCVYDRAGTGLSSAAPRPHTPQQMVDELDRLLSNAHLAGTHVLVGHSLGGLLVRLYASQHPTAVSGMVLVDPTTEEQDARMWSLMPADLMRQFKQSLSQSREGLDYDSFVRGMAELRSANRSLGNMPLVVLTAVGATEGGQPTLPDELGQQLAREWLAMHEEVSQLSSNSAHVLIEASGHDMPNEAPSVIAAAVEAVLASARTQQPVTTEAIQAAAHARKP